MRADPGIPVEARVEIQIGQEVAARHAIQRKRNAVDVDARNAGNGAGRRGQALGQVLRALAQFFVEIGVALLQELPSSPRLRAASTAPAGRDRWRNQIASASADISPRAVANLTSLRNSDHGGQAKCR